jgi:predicted nucleic acid-binding protein
VSFVVDASVVVAALVDNGKPGRWATQILLAGRPVAPALMPVEVANILRRLSQAGEVPVDIAGQAHQDLLDLPMDLLPYEPFGSRVWELRANLTAYDAWYVAVAESVRMPMATLDRRLTRAPGTHCAFETP